MDHSQVDDKSLREAVEAFLEDAVSLMHLDWDFTEATLECHVSEHVIAPGATFLRPGVPDEYNNWANRGNFLASFRQLCRAAGWSPELFQMALDEDIRRHQENGIEHVTAT